MPDIQSASRRTSTGACSSLQRVDVGTIGGQPGRHLGTFGNGAVAGDHNIDVPGGLIQPVERRLVGTH